MNNTKRFIFTLALTGLLAACTGDGKTEYIPLTITNDRIPPNIPIPEPTALSAIVWAVPRDLDQDMVPKNTTTCRETLEKDRDLKYWTKCGEYPVVTNSNIDIGMTEAMRRIQNANIELIRTDYMFLKNLLLEENRVRDQRRIEDKAEKDAADKKILDQNPKDNKVKNNIDALDDID